MSDDVVNSELASGPVVPVVCQGCGARSLCAVCCEMWACYPCGLIQYREDAMVGSVLLSEPVE